MMIQKLLNKYNYVKSKIISFVAKNNIIYPKFNYPTMKITFKAPPDYYEFWKKVERGEWDKVIFEFYPSKITSNDIIMDVGAWNGVYTLYFSFLAYNGNVHSFEPSIKSYQHTKKLLELNRIKNVQINNYAISDKEEEITFYERKALSCSNIRKIINTDEKIENIYNVNCKTIDDYCSGIQLAPDGIKIDVEGAELGVFKGGLQILKKHHPWIMLEYHGPWLAFDERKELFDIIINQLNYSITYMKGDDKKYTFGDTYTVDPDIPPKERVIVFLTKQDEVSNII